MPLTLHVDTARWREHLKSYAGRHQGIVPVTKGNGYGFGMGLLAGEAATLGVGTLAVGTYEEIDAAAGAFPGDLLVLSPWRAPTGELPDRVIHTASRVDDLRRLAAEGGRPQVVVEVLTSMYRHGIHPDEVSAVPELLDQVRFRGWALHLPLAGDRLGEARRLAARL